MKVSAILEVNGKEIKLEIPEEEIKKLIEASEKSKKTGYERVNKEETYYYIEYNGMVESDYEMPNWADNECYNTANYYSDETVAENNARADALIRKLRRFAVEHRKTELVWEICNEKYSIYYWYTEGEIRVSTIESCRSLAQIYFDTKETAELAIEEFKDELIWYFTEYKDSL